MHQTTRQFLVKALKFVVFWLVFALLFYLVGRYIRFFVPLIGGLILAGIMSPLVRLMEKRIGLPRKWAVALALVIVILVLGIVITWFTILTVQQVQDLYQNWSTYVQAVKQGVSQIWPKVELFYTGLDPKLNDAVSQSLDKLANSTYDFISRGLMKIYSFAFFLPELFIILVIALVAAYFISKNWVNYRQDLISIFPVEWQHGLRGIGNDFSKALIGFLRAQLILVTMTIVLTIGGLFILKAPYALVVGFIAGLFGILPVLGAGLVLVPWAIIEILLGKIGFGLELLALVGILSVIRHIVEPKVLGDNVGLDPLVVILSMFIGLEAIGPIGLIIGPFTIIFYKSLQKAGVFKNL